MRGLFFPPDRSIALAKQAVLVLDGTTGEEVARVAGFASPDAVAFERSGGRATRPPPVR